MTAGNRSNSSTWRSCALPILIVVGACAGYLLLTTWFNPVGWRLFTRSRIRMAQKLVDEHALDGLTDAEVADKLGPPDQGAGVWYLGTAGFGVGFLVVDFDDDGRVRSAQIIRD